MFTLFMFTLLFSWVWVLVSSWDSIFIEGAWVDRQHDRIVQCDGKIAFYHRKDAIRGLTHLKRVSGATGHVYWCRYCHSYHYGHTPEDHRTYQMRKQIKEIGVEEYDECYMT